MVVDRKNDVPSSLGGKIFLTPILGVGHRRHLHVYVPPVRVCPLRVYVPCVCMFLLMVVTSRVCSLRVYVCPFLYIYFSQLFGRLLT